MLPFPPFEARSRVICEAVPVSWLSANVTDMYNRWNRSNVGGRLLRIWLVAERKITRGSSLLAKCEWMISALTTVYRVVLFYICIYFPPITAVLRPVF